MIVLERVPLGLSHDLLMSCRVNNNLVTVDFCQESCAVLLSHIILRRINQVVSLPRDHVDKLLSVRWITHTLEEFNSLLALQLLQLTVLLDEILLVDREFHTLQIVQYGLLGFFIGWSSCRDQASQPSLTVDGVELGL